MRAIRFADPACYTVGGLSHHNLEGRHEINIRLCMGPNIECKFDSFSNLYILAYITLTIKSDLYPIIIYIIDFTKRLNPFMPICFYLCNFDFKNPFFKWVCKYVFAIDSSLPLRLAFHPAIPINSWILLSVDKFFDEVLRMILLKSLVDNDFSQSL